MEWQERLNKSDAYREELQIWQGSRIPKLLLYTRDEFLKNVTLAKDRAVRLGHADRLNSDESFELGEEGVLYHLSSSLSDVRSAIASLTNELNDLDRRLRVLYDRKNSSRGGEEL